MWNPRDAWATWCPVVFALLLFAPGSGLLFAQNAVIQAQQGKAFVHRTAQNDSAIVRAREFLENLGVRMAIVNVLHWTSVVSETTFEDVQESGSGAILTYQYGWAGADSAGRNTVTFHCDATGTIDRVMSVLPRDDHAFDQFREFLQDEKQKAIRALLVRFSRSDRERRAGPPDELEKQLYDIEAYLLARAIGTDPKSVLELFLSEAFQIAYHDQGLPAYGMDGFHFGLGTTEDYRNIAIQPQQSPEAVTRVADELRGAAADPAGRSYAAEAATIAAAARVCAQIRAHDAFRLAASGGRGAEDVAMLGPAFAVCDGPERLHPAAAGDGGVEGRPVVFSISPAGRGWRDAQGMLVEVRYQERESDPGLPGAYGFARYGMFRAHLPQTSTPCGRPAGGGTPPDRDWRQDGTNAIFRVRFDCEYAEIYDPRSHLIVADLALSPNADPRKDSYRGEGPISACPAGTGKVEMAHWSDARIELKVEEPNSYDHVCGGLKSGHPLNGLLHTDTLRVTLVPYGRR